ncbi:MAG TPA: thioesterase [Kiritimatiellia bacterium]|nr:thioesterase [Kiritimatiellia bacterium]
MDCVAPLHVHDESFCVRAYESGVNNQVTLPALCNFLQEAAGNHARALGLGIHELQDAGFTWMLARLRLEIRRYAAWRETVHLRTWPAGVRGRLTALRDFRMTDDAGETVLLGVSEWLYVEVPAQRIVRLPQAFAALAPAGTPQVPLPEAPAKVPDITAPEWSAAITVRQSDHDFNNHVNNAHYVAWALECLPDVWREARRVREIDIAFRAAARWGDTVTAEAARDTGDSGALLHRIRRDADGTLLAQVRTVWDEDPFLRRRAPVASGPNRTQGETT